MQFTVCCTAVQPTGEQQLLQIQEEQQTREQQQTQNRQQTQQQQQQQTQQQTQQQQQQQTQRQQLLLARPLPSDADDFVVSQTESEPGVSISFAPTGGLVLAYNFSALPNGSSYLGTRWTPVAAGLLSKAMIGSSITLQLKIDVPGGGGSSADAARSHWGFIRVRDSSQQYFQCSWQINASTPLDDNGWATLSQLIDPAGFTSHFGGKADGQIHLPLMAVEVDLGSTQPPVGQMQIANLSLTCVGCVAEPFGGWDVELASSHASAG